MKYGYVLTILFSLLIVLSACGNGENQEVENSSEETPPAEETSQDEMSEDEMEDGHYMEEGHGHNMSSDGDVPEGLQAAESPAYKEGDQVIIEAEHAEGHEPIMKGAEATVTGAFDTTAYAISFTPTTGGDPVTNHKWVIHEELKNAENAPLSEGTEVTLAADHMEGMDGAKATIDTAEQTTVYMVDFTTVDGEQDVTDHKWVTESELRSPE
ncbi:YdhK family protein [Halobacillus sp. Nhm2S1]|uniref:YdhK family protein n=1 Tax=Halobacillus sp. Nhm2S1 TaxID=2866716 RepID=UPI001C72C647|nr:YdhK family protein [Halobacillus sp. Nhm2S1]MBX0359399.1 YdhK family protein [Halobacillus sp. Nhm2S1]